MCFENALQITGTSCHERYEFDGLSNIDEDKKTRLCNVQEELLDTIVSNLEIVEYPTETEIFEANSILIETPYLKIPFPKQWEEYLSVEQIEGEPYKVVFSCQIDEETPVELYIYIG